MERSFEMTDAEIGTFYAQREAAEKADKLERYRRLNKFVKPGQILFVGSSLMEQFPILELLEGSVCRFASTTGASAGTQRQSSGRRSKRVYWTLNPSTSSSTSVRTI